MHTPAPPATPTPAAPAGPRHWQDLAFCRSSPTARFFGIPDRYGVDRHDPADLEEAKADCAMCDVREECLSQALDDGPDVYGVWGGTTKAEREKLHRFIRRTKCPICASGVLRSYLALQVCGSCGHSWQTVRPGQVREKTVLVA